MHLHHLTPIHEAVRALWPAVPVITHLHGTELKMLASVQDGTIPDRPGRFSRTWVERMQRWAGESDRLVVVSAQDHQLALELLNVDRERVTTIANGVDTEVFSAACSLNCPTAHAVEAMARRRSSWLVSGRRRGIDLVRGR